MKRHKTLLAMALVGTTVGLLGFSQAQAAKKVVTTTTYETDSPIRSTQSSADSRTEHGSSSGFRMGLGYAPASTLANGYHALSFMMDFTSNDTLDIQYGFPTAGTGVTIEMAGGLSYRRTVIGNHGLGMHIGLGFSLGNMSGAFATNIAGVIGARYEISNRIAILADYGPALTIAAPAAGATVNFGFRPLTSFGGLSFHFLF